MIDLSWDDIAYLISLLKDPNRRVERRIRSELIGAMRDIEGNSGNRLSPDGARRVQHHEDQRQQYRFKSVIKRCCERI